MNWQNIPEPGRNIFGKWCYFAKWICRRNSGKFWNGRKFRIFSAGLTREVTKIHEYWNEVPDNCKNNSRKLTRMWKKEARNSRNLKRVDGTNNGKFHNIGETNVREFNN